MSLGACLIANDQKGIGDAMIQRRIDGVSWKDIADEFDLGSPGAARNYFKKVTGIADFKAKGKALEQLISQMATGGPVTGANTATKAVKAVADAVSKTPTQLAEQVGVTNAKWKSVETLAKDLDLPVSAVQTIVDMNASKQGYTAIKSSLSSAGHHAVDFSKIDEVVWNDLVRQTDGKLWEAYLKKPTSENGFNAVKKKVMDLHAKGLSAEDIAKVKEAPPHSVVDAIIKDKWTMPPMGSTQPIIPPPPPPPPVVFKGTLSGNNFTHRSHDEMMQWINSLGHDLSESERAAIKRYTGSGYSEMNGHLRGLPIYSQSAPTTSIKNLSKAMKPLDKDTIVVRQVNSVKTVFKVDDLHEIVGTTYKDPAFLSTTIAPDGVWSGNVKMHISVPKGHPSRYVGDISQHKREKELILQRGTKMVVTKVQKLSTNAYGEDKWELWAEVIGVG